MSRRLLFILTIVAVLATALTSPPARADQDDADTDEPATDEPATDVPATDVPASDEPATDEPATDEPVEATEDVGTGLDGYSGLGHRGSMYHVVDQINARAAWQQGITGAGVHIAVIDTGVSPVPSLTGVEKVLAVVDLSLEATVPEAVFLDTNGHGTHVAGIIAGRSPDADPLAADGSEFLGVAPGAGLVSVKVGDNTGAVDVSQVIAGIDWVIANRNTDGLNIRVINLSYGTDSTQDYEIDPLAYAVERAWRAGIVVVVAAGNEGWTSGGLANPARDPFVLAVGAADATRGGLKIPTWTSAPAVVGGSTTAATTESPRDDRAGFWTDEYGERMPDLVAPGVSIESLRVPGSRVAYEHPEGFVTEGIMRGSGTSQAAAVVSGAVALVLEARPELTPDETKAVLRASARPLPPARANVQGTGLIDVAAALTTPAPADAVQDLPESTGLGSLQEARGTQTVTVNGTPIVGEVTVSGMAWEPELWQQITPGSLDQYWLPTFWFGASWSGASWSGASWSGASWSGASWSGASWSGASWSGASWSGASWSGASWSGASWTGASWTGASWTGKGWLGAVWT